ncbi:hypothetical protein DFH29DRAFT_918685, partial [Suillus ampliporus]
GQEWLNIESVQEWLRSPNGLQTPSGREWLKTTSGQEWLRSPSGREWLKTPNGQAWQMTPAASVWMMMDELSSTLEAISKDEIIPGLPSQPAFQVIQQFQSLPDFLIFPAFLALQPRDHSTFVYPEGPDMEIIHAMMAFAIFANEAQERSRSAS